MIGSLFGKYLKASLCAHTFERCQPECERCVCLEICYQLGRLDLYYAGIASLPLISQVHGKYLRWHSLHFLMEEWAATRSRDIMTLGLFPAQLTSASYCLFWAELTALCLIYAPVLSIFRLYLPRSSSQAECSVLLQRSLLCTPKPEDEQIWIRVCSKLYFPP